MRSGGLCRRTARVAYRCPSAISLDWGLVALKPDAARLTERCYPIPSINRNAYCCPCPGARRRLLTLLRCRARGGLIYFGQDRLSPMVDRPIGLDQLTLRSAKEQPG
jgi:hypothetical protein